MGEGVIIQYFRPRVSFATLPPSHPTHPVRGGARGGVGGEEEGEGGREGGELYPGPEILNYNPFPPPSSTVEGWYLDDLRLFVLYLVDLRSSESVVMWFHDSKGWRSSASILWTESYCTTHQHINHSLPKQGLGSQRVPEVEKEVEGPP